MAMTDVPHAISLVNNQQLEVCMCKLQSMLLGTLFVIFSKAQMLYLGCGSILAASAVFDDTVDAVNYGRGLLWMGYFCARLAATNIIGYKSQLA